MKFGGAKREKCPAPRSAKLAGGPAPWSPKGESGFTLLEMIVSLSILAAIAAFLVVAFRLAGHTLERGGEEAGGMARLRAGTEVLERALRSADPLPILAAQGVSVPYFRGERGKVRFLSAAAPSSISGGGFRLLCFFGGDTSRNAAGLMLSEGSALRAEGVDTWEGTERPRPLLSEASELAFSYSPGPTEEGKWEWEEDWDSKEKKNLPVAVRVEFLTPSEGGPRKTALVIPVLAGGA